MFQVQNTLISDDIALAKFACHLSACKGGCCVVGEGGAPIDASEVTILNKAWELLKDELPVASREEVISNGLIRGKSDDLELACVGTAECVFVQKNNEGVALCSIQKAYFDGRIGWEKPISCHLFPIRIMEISGIDFLNFEYIPEICESGAIHGRGKNEYLAEHLSKPLTRKYGEQWYNEFLSACEHVRILNNKDS